MAALRDRNARRRRRIIVGDITGDGKPEVLYVLNTINPQWWAPGPNPEQNWVKGAELAHQVNQGAAWGDIDGDGKNDYWIGNQWWFKNNGDGKMFTEMPLLQARASIPRRSRTSAISTATATTTLPCKPTGAAPTACP